MGRNASVVGDVGIGEKKSIWFNGGVRGDVNSIRIGCKVNIQDGVVIHATYKKTKTIIGDNVSIGHNAIVHGCTIRDKVLIGMGAIIMDNAEIGSNSIIAAGAVVLEGTRVEAGAIYGGTPAKKIKDVPVDLITGQIHPIAGHYLFVSRLFKDYYAVPPAE